MALVWLLGKCKHQFTFSSPHKAECGDHITKSPISSKAAHCHGGTQDAVWFCLPNAGNGFGNIGDDINTPIPTPTYSAASIRSVQGQLTPDNSSALKHSTPAGPSLNSSTRIIPGVDFATLFIPCNRSATMNITVVRQGLLTQGGDQPLGLTYPAVAVGQDGQVLLVFTYAGPRSTVDGSAAYPGTAHCCSFAVKKGY